MIHFYTFKIQKYNFFLKKLKKNAKIFAFLIYFIYICIKNLRINYKRI